MIIKKQRDDALAEVERLKAVDFVGNVSLVRAENADLKRLLGVARDAMDEAISSLHDGCELDPLTDRENEACHKLREVLKQIGDK